MKYWFILGCKLLGKPLRCAWNGWVSNSPESSVCSEWRFILSCSSRMVEPAAHNLLIELLIAFTGSFRRLARLIFLAIFSSQPAPRRLCTCLRWYATSWSWQKPGLGIVTFTVNVALLAANKLEPRNRKWLPLQFVGWGMRQMSYFGYRSATMTRWTPWGGGSVPFPGAMLWAAGDWMSSVCFLTQEHSLEPKSGLGQKVYRRLGCSEYLT